MALRMGMRPQEKPTADAESGLRLLGVVRGAPRRQPIWEAREDPLGGEAIRYRDLAAVVYPGPSEIATIDPTAVEAHHRRLSDLLERTTVVPAPFGIHFAGEREAVRFLRAAYPQISGALLLLEGRWELRVHLHPAAGVPDVLALELASEGYAELRRHAHAAIPVPRGDSGTLSAAFLVDRMETDRFRQAVEALGAAHVELSASVTGPWPAYDFVSLLPGVP